MLLLLQGKVRATSHWSYDSRECG